MIQNGHTESRYRVLWPHAMGGLGQIYVAEDQELHRRVALKEIRPEHATDPVSRERFVVEAEVTGNLEHPGIVPVHGLGVHHDGRPFYAMRFINGDNLTTAIRQFHGGTANFAGREFRWLLRRFIDVCNTVAYAHSRGVLHRDLKPSNIMLGPFGETLVMDWGVAKAAGRGDQQAAGADEHALLGDTIFTPRSGSTSVTVEGQAVGTPAYMSPEQAEGRIEAIGPASDVYSLGATFYVILTNRRPFEGEPRDVIQAVRDGRFIPTIEVNPRVPKALDAICRRAMRHEPKRALPVGSRDGRRIRAVARRRTGLGMGRADAGSSSPLGAAASVGGGRLGSRIGRRVDRSWCGRAALVARMAGRGACPPEPGAAAFFGPASRR